MVYDILLKSIAWPNYLTLNDQMVYLHVSVVDSHTNIRLVLLSLRVFIKYQFNLLDRSLIHYCTLSQLLMYS